MILKIIFTLIMAPGLLMVLAPMLPAMPYMFIVAAVFGLINDFTDLTIQNLGILGGILIASILIDYLAGLLGAKFGGASKKSLLYGLLGIIIGFIFMPPLGGFLGLFAGILFGEFVVNGKSGAKALKAATGSLMGSFVGFLISILLAVAFFTTFIIFIFW